MKHFCKEFWKNFEKKIWKKIILGTSDTCFLCHLSHRPRVPEPFLSTLQNVGVKFLQGVEKFQQVEVLFVQAACECLHAAKMHFMQLKLELFLGICTKYFKNANYEELLAKFVNTNNLTHNFLHGVIQGQPLGIVIK